MMIDFAAVLVQLVVELLMGDEKLQRNFTSARIVVCRRVKRGALVQVQNTNPK